MRAENWGRGIHLGFARSVRLPAPRGLKARDDKPLSWFTIAGKDGDFVPATAMIDGKTVVVSSDKIAEPAAVRFGWDELAEPNLMNAEKLPAGPFRTSR